MRVNSIDILNADDDKLLKISEQGLLALNFAEMKAIQNYFSRLGRNPTDVELETIAQTWSEHCVHKTFRGLIEYSQEGKTEIIDSLLKSTIMKATREINKPWCVSVFSDNAGIIEFDENYNVVFKVETHNHPSAIEPYGGAGTGIGGVIRDPLGTGLGAKPILNTDVFCFGPPDLPYDELPRGTLHPKRIFKGVVAGVRDYGNRMGIPTANGAILFDRRYTCNPLVYCGNVGLIPKDRCRKKVNVGDLAVVVGGRTGRDGIHGVTFASLELDESSERLGSAVQIGNPIVEKKMADTLLQARDKQLYSAITDCGGGGLSSAFGEMGEEVGLRIDLEKVPLKYTGLVPWEIWISESQERMALAVPPEKINELLEVFSAEDVEATVIGEFTGDRKLRLFYEGKIVADLDMEFLHDGLPRITKKAIFEKPIHSFASLRPALEGSEGTGSEPEVGSRKSEVGSRNATVLSKVKEHTKFHEKHEMGKDTNCIFSCISRTSASSVVKFRNPKSEIRNPKSDLTPYLLNILSSPNVASKEWVIRQYDHEVQGGSILKPLQGIENDGPGDACIVAPVLSSKRGIIVANGINPKYSDIDPYDMAASAIDEALRNVISVGGTLQRTALLDNFSWGNPDKPDRLGALVRACKACYDIAVAYGTPFISGKDSLYNEYQDTETGEQVAIPHTLLISAICVMDDVTKAVSMDAKGEGDLIYVVGKTYNEMGGSHYYAARGFIGNSVPQVRPEEGRRTMESLSTAIKNGLVRACHDCSEGGIGVSAAEMAFAGGYGMKIDLRKVPKSDEVLRSDVLLFSESNSRFIVEVKRELQSEFEQAMEGTSFGLIGEIIKSKTFEVIGMNGQLAVSAQVEELKSAWKETFDW
jgi:phosphoribosylformylglycinamidine synthase